MKDPVARICRLGLVHGAILVLAGAAAGAQEAGKEKTAEQAFKNIQVLQSLPQSQLMPVMHFMRSSLGVRCDHCHVAENGKYWMDDKPAKQKIGRASCRERV